MRYKTIYNAFLSISLLMIIALGCSGISDKNCGTGVKPSMLKRILNSVDNKAFDDALMTHGSITQDELPCIVSATENRSPTRRKNAARLLVLVGGDAKVILGAQKKVVLATKDVFVWAKVMDSLMDRRTKANPAQLASKRHDMIQKALSDKDSFIQSVGLKAGVLAKYPGVNAQLEKRLESMDPKLLEVALDALPREKAMKELPRLLGMLEEYESGTQYLDYEFKLYFFTPLLNALIRTEDPKAFAAVRTALEKDYKNAHLVRGTREEYSTFRNTAATLKIDSSINKFLFYLIKENSIAKPSAIEILTTQIKIGKQEPNPEIVMVCIETIENGNLDNTDWRNHSDDKREQLDCEMFFKFLESGTHTNVGEGKRKLGSDAVEFGRKWLMENRK